MCPLATRKKRTYATIINPYFISSLVCSWKVTYRTRKNENGPFSCHWVKFSIIEVVCSLYLSNLVVWFSVLCVVPIASFSYIFVRTLVFSLFLPLSLYLSILSLLLSTANFHNGLSHEGLGCRHCCLCTPYSTSTCPHSKAIGCHHTSKHDIIHCKFCNRVFPTMCVVRSCDILMDPILSDVFSSTFKIELIESFFIAAGRIQYVYGHGVYI